MKKFILWLLTISLIFTVGCTSNKVSTNESNTESNPRSSNNSYEGKGMGYGGEIKLELITEGNKMVDIKIISDAETSPVMTRAFPVIKERILEAQSPIVDSVSGATYTSFGIKTAVAEAAKGYGQDFGKITFDTQGPETERRELEPVNTKLLVVGGGPAGLAAAISAKESGVDDIILIEKLDILSGNGKFDMNFFDMINSKAQKENGINITAEDFIKGKGSVADSKERVTVWAQGASEVDEWLRSFGVNLNYSYGETNHMAESDAYAGEHIQDGMEKRVKELGIDVRTGTKGLDLIFDGNKIVGVKVQHKNDYYDILADAVILATGGFSANKELLAKYAPGAELVETSNQMGATGDFIPVFEKNNLQLENMDVLSVFKMIIKGRRDLTGAGDGFIFVNENGERFVDETSSGLELAHTILEQPNGKVYYIYDQRLYESFYRLKKHNDLGYHEKADTLEELAEKLGVNGENLVKSVDTYNKAVDGEIKDPFRKESFAEKFGEKGPYYGVQVESAIHMTKGGVLANEKTEVLNTNKEVVEGLYAAGEVTATSAAYSGAVVFGRISGKEAAEFIKNKN
ncbi:FAD-binding protein [Alkaliphilus sp. MSJ-5]|uniref:Urocanate reductase n=1 Tax=Alkaliphilus flagellatus TaxID=2841507 RepID=A0ABS6FXA0_9FIRM|nr:FAD-binding protein [Alkaliphilus flagellatus]MBU5674870.1 FAD-binding protein [Alkaliphilus flagellatus]